MTNNELLRVEGLVKTYHDGERELKVLRGVDCTFRRGEAVAIVGQSGSGKSTLLNLIGTLDRPTSGKIVLDHEDLATLPMPKLNQIRRERLGFIFQFHHLLPEFRAWENVAVPAWIAGTSPSQAKKKALEMLDRVGLSERASHIPSKMSGGEQQRVSLARALMNDPDVILADEPTGNLDVETSMQVIDILWKATRDRDRLLVIVTHEPSIAAHADRTMTLREGKLISITNKENA
ncbi:TPA: lipoprotein-releasing system ATP-binding protein LolD [Candidatus Sumerlaeota bacterium]|nr:lipoprotein-releasing system ATP-binding protein LolD [Candidatus Sumerlaeota bacterium]